MAAPSLDVESNVERPWTAEAVLKERCMTTVVTLAIIIQTLLLFSMVSLVLQNFDILLSRRDTMSLRIDISLFRRV